MTKKAQYQHKLQYNNNYNRTNYHSFSIRFNINNEADVIEWLESKESLKSYINSLITADMKKQAKKAAKEAEKKTK